jgi:hypothetical protein
VVCPHEPRRYEKQQKGPERPRDPKVISLADLKKK